MELIKCKYCHAILGWIPQIGRYFDKNWVEIDICTGCQTNLDRGQWKRIVASKKKCRSRLRPFLYSLTSYVL